MTRNILPCHYVLVKKESIIQMLQEWRLSGLKLSYIRLRVAEIFEHNERLKKSKRHKEYSLPIPIPVLKYVSCATSRCEIAVLFYLTHRYMWGASKARFKLKDISAVTGLSVRKLSHALCQLRQKNIIITKRIHQCFIIAHGSHHYFSPSFLVPNSSLTPKH